MPELTGRPGFTPPHADRTLSKRRAAALELIATVTLTVSLVIAVTAVSMGSRSPGPPGRGEVVSVRPSSPAPLPQH